MRISDWSSDVCSSDLAGLRVEHRAGNSGLHALRTANQQLDAKNFFKLLDLARQRRLRNIHDACCRAKAPLPHNSYEISQMPQFNGTRQIQHDTHSVSTLRLRGIGRLDRKSTRLNSSH